MLSVESDFSSQAETDFRLLSFQYFLICWTLVQVCDKSEEHFSKSTASIDCHTRDSLQPCHFTEDGGIVPIYIICLVLSRYRLCCVSRPESSSWNTRNEPLFRSKVTKTNKNDWTLTLSCSDDSDDRQTVELSFLFLLTQYNEDDIPHKSYLKITHVIIFYPTG